MLKYPFKAQYLLYIPLGLITKNPAKCIYKFDISVTVHHIYISKEDVPT